MNHEDRSCSRIIGSAACAGVSECTLMPEGSSTSGTRWTLSNKGFAFAQILVSCLDQKFPKLHCDRALCFILVEPLSLISLDLDPWKEDRYYSSWGEQGRELEDRDGLPICLPRQALRRSCHRCMRSPHECSWSWLSIKWFTDNKNNWRNFLIYFHLILLDLTLMFVP